MNTEGETNTRDSFGFTIYFTYNPIVHIKVVNSIFLEVDQLGERVPWVPEGLYNGNYKLKDVTKWIETRLPDKKRSDINDIIHRYGLKEFLPWSMVRKSHGRNMTDGIWIKFDDEEDVTYDDIRLR